MKTGEILQSVAAQAPGPTPPDAVDESAALHPLLARRPEKKVLIVVLSADRGLCGAFNTNMNKAAEREWRAHARPPARRSRSSRSGGRGAST